MKCLCDKFPRSYLIPIKVSDDSGKFIRYAHMKVNQTAYDKLAKLIGGK